jgi:hypothetical protein
MLKLSYFLLNLLVVIVYNICLICCKEILHKNSCNIVMLNCYFFVLESVLFLLKLVKRNY